MSRRATPTAAARPRRRLLSPWRMLAGFLAVVALSAIATNVIWNRQVVDKLTSALSHHKSLSIKTSDLAQSSFGGAETLLLIGNDQRAHTSTTPVLPHSNEMLLVRLDPSKPWISMMSIPRELAVNIDTPNNGVVYTRLNAALLYGGISLVVKTIKQVTGLAVNHVVVIDFNNFVKAVNDMGCVYSTIDRRYFHVNTPGAPAVDNYTEVNLQPGYQRLCGSQALQFVTYRHGDTSQVRDARDQDFLLSVKQQYGPTLVDHVGLFERIFGELVQTDSGLQTSAGVSDLLGTLISSAGLPVRQVHFQTNLGAVPAPCTCDKSSPQQIKASVNSFLYGTNSTLSEPKVLAVAKSVAQSQSGSKAKSRKAKSQASKHTVASPYLPTGASDKQHAASVALKVGFPVWFPTVAVNNGQALPVAWRSYSIVAPNRIAYPSYVTVFSTGMLGQFYDIQGSLWRTPPILDDPSAKIRFGSRLYYLYYSNHTILQVAWFAGGAAYWVRNTLTDSLSGSEMLAIAERSVAYDPPGTALARARFDARASAAPSAILAGSTSLRDTLGLIAGLLSVVVALVLTVFTVREFKASRRAVRRFDENAARRLDLIDKRVTMLNKAATRGGTVRRRAPEKRRTGPAEPPR